jgi:uncharacterized delta-60 repeat protein
VGILLGLATAASASAVVPGPGELDPSFANGGRTTLNVAYREYAAGVAVDAQDRIIVAGTAQTGSRGDFLVARFLPSGLLDPSFGTGGVVRTDFDGGDDRAVGVGLDSSGRIVVAGTNPSHGGYGEVARYTPNGKLDPAFGDAGKALVSLGRQGGDIDAVTIDSQNRIVLGGRAYRPHDMFDYYDFAVARLTPGGKPDPTFGREGLAVTNFRYTLDDVHSIAVDSQGRIVAAGEANAYGESSEFALARYRPGGGLDTSFGGTGMVQTQFANGPYDYYSDFAYAVAIGAGDRVVAAGGGGGSADDFALAGYRVNGNLDPAFGTNGKVETSFPDFALARGLVTDRLGRLVAAGSNISNNASEFALARYEPDGGLDRSFGKGGQVITPFTHGYAQGAGIAIDSRGRLVVVGTVGFGARTDLGLARYIGRDKEPPDVRVKGHSRFRTRHPQGRAHFRLVASEPAEFRCKVDDGRFRKCSSPYRTNRLPIGRHKLKVHATDQAGNVGDARKRFRIVAKD